LSAGAIRASPGPNRLAVTSICHSSIAAVASWGGEPGGGEGHVQGLVRLLADGRECKVITGIDDHSRFCVIAAVVMRATARAVTSRPCRVPR
jgi:hypothetical protein